VDSFRCDDDSSSEAFLPGAEIPAEMGRLPGLGKGGHPAVLTAFKTASIFVSRLFQTENDYSQRSLLSWLNGHRSALLVQQARRRHEGHGHFG
jgi:hypothetical protein